MDDLSSLLQSLPTKEKPQEKEKEKESGRFTQALDNLKRAGEQAENLKSDEPIKNQNIITAAKPAREPVQAPKRTDNPKKEVSKQAIVELCRGCGLPITKQDHDEGNAVLIAETLPFHIECIKCHACGIKLTDEVYDLQGQVYCLEHFEEISSSKCGYCNELVTESYVTALDKKWHMEHFFCSHCGNVFEDGQFMENDGKPYCKPHYLQLFAPSCGKCGKPIAEEGLNALNQMFHASCFNCFVFYILT